MCDSKEVRLARIDKYIAWLQATRDLINREEESTRP
jgi:hypothetical protein